MEKRHQVILLLNQVFVIATSIGICLNGSIWKIVTTETFTTSTILLYAPIQFAHMLWSIIASKTGSDPLWYRICMIVVAVYPVMQLISIDLNDRHISHLNFVLVTIFYTFMQFIIFIMGTLSN